MTTPHAGFPAARALPPRPNLEFLKNEAKRRLHAQRAAHPDAKLSEVQFQLAREHGFASWRDLKAGIDQRSAGAAPDPTGDWIARFPSGMLAVALHIRRSDTGRLRGTIDVPRQGYFDDPIDAVSVDEDRLSFTITVRGVNVLYDGAWDSQAQQWVGTWTQTGIEQPLCFARGTLPPAPVIEGLDGLWDGHLRPKAGDVRLTFRIRTDEHGTLAWLESSRSEGKWFAAESIVRDGAEVTIALATRTVQGRLSEDGQTIEGLWTVGEKRLPLVLARRRPGAPTPRISIPEAIALPPEALAAFVGTYKPEAGPPMMLAIEAGGLWIRTPTGQLGFELVPTGPNAFFTRQADATVTFEQDPAGRVTAMLLQMQGREMRHPRVL